MMRILCFSEVFMHPLDLFFGSPGRIFSSILIMVILGLMYAMSYKLYITRRKKAYLSICISLAIAILQYILILFVELVGQFQHHWVDYVTQAMKGLAFIQINRGMYRLYRTQRQREKVIFFTMILTVLLLLLRHTWMALPDIHDNDLQSVHRDLWLDGFLLVVTVCFGFFIGRHIRETGKYRFALTVYGIVIILHMVNTGSGHKPSILIALEYFLPAVFYITLFLIFLNRLAEVLQSTYASSITDGLTGLYNRKYFYQAVKSCIHSKMPVSVIFSDIDNFKMLNDTQGHQTGDDTLRKVAGIMKEESEEAGLAGRYGGEEMVLLITDSSIVVQDLAERIRQRVENETGVTVSVGFSAYTRGLSPEQLIKQADAAMYEAKHTGKNKVVDYRRLKHRQELTLH
jgi:diguanylate cyclase (GGDEF)-like protein